MTIGNDTLPSLPAKEDQGGESKYPFTNSRLLLSADSAELHSDTHAVVDRVRLFLIPTAIVVVKRPSEKSADFSLLRRHPLKDIQVTLLEREGTKSAVIVDSLSRRCAGEKVCVYQMENGGDAKEWVVRCRERLGGDGLDIPPKVNEFSPASPRILFKERRAFSSPNSPVCSRRGSRDEENSPKIPVCATTRQSGVHSSCSYEESSLEFSNDRVLHRRHARRDKNNKRNLSTSDLALQEGAENGRTATNEVISEKLKECIADLSPPPSPPPELDAFVRSPFRHVQIRRGKRQFSPRLIRSNSARPTSTTPSSLIDKYSRAHSTPSPCLSATLPRRRPKGKSDTGEGITTPSSSPMPRLAAKSPKLLKLFHRRSHSSTTIKLYHIDNCSETASLGGHPEDMMSPLPSRRKLHLFPPKDVAVELSLMDGELLRKISPDEIKNGAWMDKCKTELAPNVLAMVQSFNRLALLVPTEVLEERTPQTRSKVITAFIQIANKCYCLHNYNSLKAIIAGLQCTPIHRLKKTWKEVPSKRRKRFNQLSQLMSEEDNWKLYREDLERNLTTGASCIPFLGLFLTQVVQQESYHKMRAEKNADHALKRRSSSFDNCAPKTMQANVLRVRETCSSVSAPTSPAFTDDEEDLDQPSKHKGPDDRPRTNDPAIEKSSLLAQQSSFATSESSLDSKCSVEDYLKNRKSTNLQSTPVRKTNDYVRHTTVCPKVSIEDEDALEQSFESVDFGILHQVSSTSKQNDDIILIGTPQMTRLLPTSSHDCSLPKSCSQESLESSTSKLEINFGVKKSKSLNSLQGVSCADERLRNIYVSTLAELSRLSASLQSIDSVFSIEDDSSLNLASELELSDCYSEVSLSQQYSLADSASSTPLTPQVRSVRRTLIMDTDERDLRSSLRGVPTLNDEHTRRFSLRRPHRMVIRSKSWAANTKSQLRRKNTANKIPSLTPLDLLHQYQLSSLGSVSGLNTKVQLRMFLTECEYNSECQNYKLSYEREPV